MPWREPVKFLLVDDLPENLRALEALLRRDGLLIHQAASGTEALELLLQHEYSLALLDVQMPDMDGFELAELMRGTERTRTVPIIFITAAEADEGRRFRGYEAGAVDYVFKPLDPLIVRSKAKVFFDLGQQRQELARQRNALQKSAAELSTALHRIQAHADNSPLGIVEFDPDLRLLSWSKGAERMFGWSDREVVGKHLGELDWVPASEIEDLLSNLSKALTDRDHRRGLYTVGLSRKYGGTVNCEWYSSVLRDSEGRAVSLSVQILDITERRKAAETQRLLVGELNHRVKNTLATVQAIATQTLRHTLNPEEFSQTFSGRIQSLARAHAMLSVDDVIKPWTIEWGPNTPQKQLSGSAPMLPEPILWPRCVRNEADVGRVARPPLCAPNCSYVCFACHQAEVRHVHPIVAHLISAIVGCNILRIESDGCDGRASPTGSSRMDVDCRGDPPEWPRLPLYRIVRGQRCCHALHQRRTDQTYLRLNVSEHPATRSVISFSHDFAPTSLARYVSRKASVSSFTASCCTGIGDWSGRAIPPR